MAVTFEFQEIFPTYDSWKSIMTDIVGDDAVNVEVDKFIFSALMENYRTCNVRYTSPDAFVSMCRYIYRNKFNMYVRKKKAIESALNLTDDDLTVLTQTINNNAYNENTMPENPYQPLTFISSQQFSQAQANKFQAYITFINEIPDFKLENLLYGENGFDKLFLGIAPNNKYFYRG